MLFMIMINVCKFIERFICLYFEMGAPTLFISCLISYVLVLMNYQALKLSAPPRECCNISRRRLLTSNFRFVEGHRQKCIGGHNENNEV